jgi:hypothetical protein
MSVLKDGFSTIISFTTHPAVKLYEKEVTPPGLEMGGAIDTTTMRNDEYRTKYPRSLKTLTEAPFTAAYDTDVYDDIIAMAGVNQLITVTFSDGSSVEFWGWLEDFKPQAVKEGEQPVAQVKIECSNVNDSDEETAPVRNAPA